MRKNKNKNALENKLLMMYQLEIYFKATFTMQFKLAYKVICMLLFLIIFSIQSSFAQDSVKVLLLEDLFLQIAAHHPIAKQAILLSESARQEFRLSKAYFDPLLSSKYLNKSFKGNNYFDLWDSYLQVPIWYGADFKVGYEKNSGPNINPEDYTPSSGLTYLGISLPLGQGLIIDERRATLRQARLLNNLAEADKVKIINKLLLQTAKDYWDWMYCYKKWQLNLQGYKFAQFSLKTIKERVVNGDLAAIDSLEAEIQVQNFDILAQQSQLDYRNASLIISNYLWKDGAIPVELASNVIPSEVGTETTLISKDSIEKIAGFASEKHPDLIKLNTKIRQLEIERLNLKDKFKPKLTLEYNLLQQDFLIKRENFNTSYITNNYKIGVSFSQPLFLRKERSKLQLTKIKILEANFSYSQANREILSTITTAYNEWIGLENQIRLQEQSVKNYELLRNGEQQRFENGESSLFIINQRDVGLISSRIKLYELKVKYAKNKMYLQWAAGNILSNLPNSD